MRRHESAERGSSEGVDIRRIALDLAHRPAVDVRIRRGARTRHVRINVDEHGGVTASIPARFRITRLDTIVRDRAEWLDQTMRRMEAAARATEVDLRRGDPICLLGTWRPVRVVDTFDSRRSRVEVRDDVVEVQLARGQDPHDVLLAWYRAHARTVIRERTMRWASQWGLRVGKLSIREQRTRWGSCSSRGDLSFNWRLIMAPEWVLDSIIVHELCHIDELNHSARFWALLDERYPAHRDASEWLASHGATLRVSRPTPTTIPPAAATSVGRAWPGSIGMRPRARARARAGESDTVGPGDQLTLFTSDG